ncbi:MAG: DNA polymerase III subunit gamma/tau [Oscillospiraceae bacterium]|nr:DNA polymerase III subunit gamma/tau [Oscillospiraceae bacterium]
MAAYQALYRKYRPRTFDEVAGQEHITSTLSAQVRDGKTSHAYIFVGTRGTGKTSCAKILARAVNCERPVNGNPCNECDSCRGIENDTLHDVLEMDAASNNGVENVRELRDEAIYSPSTLKKRVYIIDEVHMLSTQAFNALLKILEEPPSHVLFILATTELHKVPATVLSRCQRFSFRRIAQEKIQARLAEIARREGFELTDSAAEIIARLGDGSMRDALSLLERCVGADSVDEATVRENLGLVGRDETLAIMRAVADHDAAAAIAILDRLYSDGWELGSVLDECARLTRDLLVTLLFPKGGLPLLSGAAGARDLAELAARFTPERLLLCADKFDDVKRQRRNTKLHVELCLLQLTIDNDEQLTINNGQLTIKNAGRRTINNEQLTINNSGTTSRTGTVAEPANPIVVVTVTDPSPLVIDTAREKHVAEVIAEVFAVEPVAEVAPDIVVAPEPVAVAALQASDAAEAIRAELESCNDMSTVVLFDGHGHFDLELEGNVLKLLYKNPFAESMSGSTKLREQIIAAAKRATGLDVVVKPVKAPPKPAADPNAKPDAAKLDKLRNSKVFSGE